MEQGVKQCIEQGIEQGIKQRDKEIVITMRNNKVDIKTITKYTKLSETETNEIINNE